MTILRLELAGNDPVRANGFKACTYTDLAIAWQNNRRHVEGIGYKIKRKK